MSVTYACDSCGGRSTRDDNAKKAGCLLIDVPGVESQGIPSQLFISFTPPQTGGFHNCSPYQVCASCAGALLEQHFKQLLDQCFSDEYELNLCERPRPQGDRND